jgi:2-polyprenyl-3-methyl-5-hydroxy-6-metoxy-1,4-benzoquinol methylase
MNSLFENIPCRICGGSQYTVLAPSTYPKELNSEVLQGIYSSSSDHMLMDRLVRCDSCALVYLNPQVRSDIILRSYEDAVDPTFIQQNALRIATFRRNLSWLCRRLNIEPSREQRVLDIGCAGGAFPVAANDFGFSVVGVEPSRWLAEQARSRYHLDIRSGPLEAQDFAPHSFDLITLWDVIEHLTDPGQVVGRIHELLKKDGLLVVNYPDHSSYARRLMGMRWPFYLSVHLTYFTPQTMKRFLGDHGFEVELLRPYWQTLELGYALERAGAYFDLFKILARGIKYLGLGRVPLRYNMGQTLLVARKRP